MKCHKLPLVVAGVIFSVMAILHLLRLFIGWNIVLGTFMVPVWWSGIGLIIAGGLAFWMLKAAMFCEHCSHSE